MTSNLRHSLRNVWRNKTRTITVSLIIGIAVFLVLTMTTIDAGIKDQVQTLAANVGTGIDVRPAGSFGGFGQSGMLDEAVIEQIRDHPHVAAMDTVFAAMMQSSGLGARGLMVMGVSPGDPLQLMGGGSAEIAAGRNFSPEDNGEHVVIIGLELATAQEWMVGDIVTIGETELEIIGVADSDIRFGRMGMFLPVKTAQALLGMEGQISQVHIQVDHLDNVDAVLGELRALLGDEADVVAHKERLLQPVEKTLRTIESVARMGLLMALATAGIVVFATMIIIVRERTREIGILKAIGASRLDIGQLFTMEALALVMLGLVVGSCLFMAGNEIITSRLVSMYTPDVSGQEIVMERVRGMGQMFSGRFGQAGVSVVLGDMDIALQYELLLLSLGAVVVTGFLGSLLPAWYAARLKPAEVLRNE